MDNDVILGVAIKHLVSRVMCAKVDDLNRNTTLHDDLGADSLDEVDLIMDLEDEFDVDITDAEMSTISLWTIQDIVDLIKRKLEAK